MNSDHRIGSFEPDDITVLDRAFREALRNTPETTGRAFDIRRTVASAVIVEAKAAGLVDPERLERAGSVAAAGARP